MLVGTITAPWTAACSIANAGFVLKEWGPAAGVRTTRGDAPLWDFAVEGPRDALTRIEHHWGDWIWSLTEQEEKAMAENVLFNMPELMEALDRGSATVEQQNAAFVLLAFAREVGDWSKVEAAMFVHLRAMNRAEIRKRPC